MMNEKMFDALNKGSSGSNYADDYVERIENAIEQMKNELSINQSILIYVILNDGSKILEPTFGYHNPLMIKVTGFDEDQNECLGLLNQNDIQVIIKKVNK